MTADFPPFPWRDILGLFSTLSYIYDLFVPQRVGRSILHAHHIYTHAVTRFSPPEPSLVLLPPFYCLITSILPSNTCQTSIPHIQDDDMRPISHVSPSWTHPHGSAEVESAPFPSPPPPFPLPTHRTPPLLPPPRFFRTISTFCTPPQRGWSASTSASGWCSPPTPFSWT